MPRSVGRDANELGYCLDSVHHCRVSRWLLRKARVRQVRLRMPSDLVFSLQHSGSCARQTSQVLGIANAARAEPSQEFLGSPSPLGQRRCFLHPVDVMYRITGESVPTVDMTAALITVWFSRREILSHAEVTGKYKPVKSVLQRRLDS